MAMEAAGRYNLAWTDFDQYTTTAFKDLGARREFVDVTLACEGDVQVQAHKVILAACSSWFRSVLLRNSHPHPLIYLDSIGPEQLEALVGFMYTGETNIPQGEFEDFMRAAKRYRVAGLMVDGEEEERVKQEQPNIFPLVPLEEIKKIKKKIKRETKVESRMEDTPVQSDVLTEVDVMEQEEDEEEEEQEQDAKEEEEEAEEEDQEEVDEADVLCKGEIVPEMNITMDADAEDVADDEDDEEEETEEMPESDVSNLFINGEEGEEDEEEEGAGDIVSADTLDDMMSYDEDVNDEENEQKEEDEEEGEEEEENDDDEEEEGEEEDDEEDPRDPDYEIEEDEEEDHVTLGETLKEETKVEPSEVFSEAITKVLIKSENENVNDLYKGTPVLSIQKKRKGCRPSTLMKVKLARSLY